jgi:hypothetical protein
MRHGGTALKDPNLLREDEVIYERVRTQLNNCAEFCRDEASRARDTSFRHALTKVAEACDAGIQALQAQAHAQYEEASAPQLGPTPLPPKERDWRPGADTGPDD